MPVRVTEFDLNTENEQPQADYKHDFIQPSSVSASRCGGRMAVGCAMQNATMYRRGWTAKPNMDVGRKLIDETWDTDATGTTALAGRWSAASLC